MVFIYLIIKEQNKTGTFPEKNTLFQGVSYYTHKRCEVNGSFATHFYYAQIFHW
jgi:hypothetical protein